MSTNSDRKLPSSLMLLKKIVEGTSTYTGEEFFKSLVKNMAEVLDAYGVWVTEYDSEKNRLKALAFWANGEFISDYEYDITGTPCETVLKSDGVVHVPEKAMELYPNDEDGRKIGMVSYMGISLNDTTGAVCGHLALLDQKPMEEIPEAFAIFRIFASRATAELNRLRSERLLKENESKLNRLMNGTMEAIIEMDEDLIITQANDATLKTFEATEVAFIGESINSYLNNRSFQKLTRSIQSLKHQKESIPSTWIQGHLICLKANDESFPAEATLSGYYYDDHHYYALYLRNVMNRVKTQEELKQLNVEATMLRERVEEHHFADIIGQSEAITRSLEQVQQVAPSDSTVLILGETGTGKELFARAIHQASQRSNKPLITLNCATLPGELIESELFGHVKGAFTGASSAREGRFTLANNGTIFLDEVGELPLKLQAKLLRVLQEGEFEPVGSSKTQKVNVRIIAATNRNLEEEVKNADFRKDLYYRLSVFPISVPPLRDRGNDILNITEAFLKKYGHRAGLTVSPLSEAEKQKLLAYHWPGNVRELQNIIERAIITSKDGVIELPPLTDRTSLEEPKSADPKRIIRESELIELERRNIILALEQANGRISGKNGAAQLLDIPPTTLNSRISKLAIK